MGGPPPKSNKKNYGKEVDKVLTLVGKQQKFVNSHDINDKNYFNVFSKSEMNSEIMNNLSGEKRARAV